MIEAPAVVGSVSDEAFDIAIDLLKEAGHDCGIVCGSVSELLCYDNAICVNAYVELPPTSNAFDSMLRGRPLVLATDSPARAVYDEVGGTGGGPPMKGYFELAAATRKGRVVRRHQVELHQLEHGAEKAFGLSQASRNTSRMVSTASIARSG